MERIFKKSNCSFTTAYIRRLIHQRQLIWVFCSCKSFVSCGRNDKMVERDHIRSAGISQSKGWKANMHFHSTRKYLQEYRWLTIGRCEIYSHGEVQLGSRANKVKNNEGKTKQKGITLLSNTYWHAGLQRNQPTGSLANWCGGTRFPSPSWRSN